MSIGMSGGFARGPGEGEALWFNRGLGVLKATGDLTQGRFTVLELLAPKGFASPIHVHRAEDEVFVVLSGEVRVRHDEDVVEAVAGSLVYGPETLRTGSTSTRRKLDYSCSSGRLASRGFSVTVGNRLGSWGCHLPMSSSSIDRRSPRS